MIIVCPCKEKKFEIDAALIPQEGRILQCGSCGHKWFYKIDQETKITSIDEPSKKISNNTNKDTKKDQNTEITKNQKSLTKKIDKIIKDIQKSSFSRSTLGSCLIEKVNQTVIISKEQ